MVKLVEFWFCQLVKYFNFWAAGPKYLLIFQKSTFSHFMQKQLSKNIRNDQILWGRIKIDNYTLRCNKIATIVFFSNIFSAIFRNYSSRSPSNVLYIKMFSRICSFLQVNSFLGKGVHLTVISPWSWPSFYSSPIFWVGEAPG
jgi:hypothetical protein